MTIAPSTVGDKRNKCRAREPTTSAAARVQTLIARRRLNQRTGRTTTHHRDSFLFLLHHQLFRSQLGKKTRAGICCRQQIKLFRRGASGCKSPVGRLGRPLLYCLPISRSFFPAPLLDSSSLTRSEGNRSAWSAQPPATASSTWANRVLSGSAEGQPRSAQSLLQKSSRSSSSSSGPIFSLMPVKLGSRLPALFS